MTRMTPSQSEGYRSGFILPAYPDSRIKNVHFLFPVFSLLIPHLISPAQNKTHLSSKQQ